MSGFSDDLERLRERIGGEAAHPSELMADLETAYEELRTADEEIRSQQEQISALTVGFEAARLQQERMLALLPVPVLITDADGMTRWANAAAAAFFGMRSGRIVGTPAFSFVATEHRRELRSALTALTPGRGPVRHTVAILPRPDEPTTMDVTLSHDTEQPGRVTWMLLLRTAVPAETSPGLEALPDTLAKLSLVPAQSHDARAALQAAALLVSAALGDMEVSLSIGSPLEPETTATTSTIAQMIDGAQVAAGEGPSVVAYESATLIESDDVAADDRWPRLAGRVPAATAAIAAPLLAGGSPIGSLNAYGRAQHLVGGRVEACELLATTVAAAVSELRARDELASLAADLERAMASRAVIEQAKGIIMGARHCDEQTAFEQLVRLSSTKHVKLREIAAMLVGGTLDHGGLDAG